MRQKSNASTAWGDQLNRNHFLKEKVESLFNRMLVLPTARNRSSQRMQAASIESVCNKNSRLQLSFEEQNIVSYFSCALRKAWTIQQQFPPPRWDLSYLKHCRLQLQFLCKYPLSFTVDLLPSCTTASLNCGPGLWSLVCTNTVNFFWHKINSWYSSWHGQLTMSCIFV